MTRSAAGLALAVLLLALPACRDNEPAVARGDRLWADSAFTAALAEYRLAAAQRGDEQALSRLAHAFARAGDLTETRETYARLLEDHPEHADQAVYDFVRLARRALERGDEFDAATALDAALALRPELRMPEAAAAVARFYRRRGDTDRAAAYYRRALSQLPQDSAPRLLYELGVLESERERCDVAVDYFRAFRAQAERDRNRWRLLLGETRWHIGSCAFRLGQRALQEGQATTALDWLDTTIELGEPENLLDQAWFDRGQLLYALGRFDEALAAYRQVLERSPARTGQLVERAQARIDDIRFGVLPTNPDADTAALPRPVVTPPDTGG